MTLAQTKRIRTYLHTLHALSHAALADLVALAQAIRSCVEHILPVVREVVIVTVVAVGAVVAVIAIVVGARLVVGVVGGVVFLLVPLLLVVDAVRDVVGEGVRGVIAIVTGVVRDGARVGGGGGVVVVAIVAVRGVIHGIGRGGVSVVVDVWGTIHVASCGRVDIVVIWGVIHEVGRGRVVGVGVHVVAVAVHGRLRGLESLLDGSLGVGAVVLLGPWLDLSLDGLFHLRRVLRRILNHPIGRRVQSGCVIATGVRHVAW